MNRYTLRLLVALLAFSVGITVARTIRLMNDVAIVEQVSSLIRIPSFNTNAAEANEVYKVILREKYPLTTEARLLVLNPRITNYIPLENAGMRKELGNDGSFSETIRQLIPDADTETLDNYHSANSFGGPLKLSAPDLNVVFADISDISSLDVGAFWSEFYKRYPDSYGIIYFSRVGFNDRGDQAFVYTQRSCQDTCGSGSYVLLGKTNGKWHMLRESVLWIS